MHRPHERPCKQCGSTYWITSEHIRVRDKDSISCEVCGAVLIEWNEARVYDAKLLKRKDWPQKQ